MANLMLIINPAAGSSGYKNNFGEALCTLDKAGYRVTTYFTQKKGDAIQYTAEYADKYDVVACVGGDGTLSEVLSGMMQIEESKRPPIGYFPMGTANDVATSLDLPKSDSARAAKRMIEGRPHHYDVGGFGKEYFAYIAAFGAFTEVSYETPQEMKRAFGHLAYVLQGATAIQNIEPYHAVVEYDEGIIEGNFLYGSVSNSTSVAGIVKLKDEMVTLGDGESELVLVKDPGDAIAMAELISSILTQRFDSEYMQILHTTHAKFTFDKPVAWTRDGEAGGMNQEIDIYNFPCAVQLIF